MKKRSSGGAVRRTITLSSEADKAVSFLIGENGNYSEFVERAVRAQAQHLRIDALLAEQERKYGPIPKEIEQWAHEVWLARKKRRKRSRSTAVR